MMVAGESGFGKMRGKFRGCLGGRGLQGCQPIARDSIGKIDRGCGVPTSGLETQRIRLLSCGTGIHRLGSVADDLPKAAALEAGTADEESVHIRHGHEFCGITGFHAAAVLDADAGGAGFIVEFLDDLANECMGVLGLLGSGDTTGADGPDGLIGDDGAGGLLGIESGESGGELPTENGFDFPAIALLKGFAHAKDGLQMIMVGGDDFFVDEFIRFAKKAAAFAVTEDDVGDVHRAEHHRAGFAREGTALFVVHVLSREADMVAVRKQRLCRGEADGGRGDDDVHPLFGMSEAQERFEEILGFRRVFEHFPIGGDDRLAHFDRRV